MRPAVTDALTAALFLEWAERGYGALSLEAVARRAGVGKAALYRRWPSKLAMVADRFEVVGKALARPPDAGNLHDDVRALLGDFARLLRHPVVRRILPDLQGEIQRSPELAALVRERLVVDRRSYVEDLLRRAMERGELHSRIDVELANDAIVGILYWRIVALGRRIRRDELEALATFIVSGLEPAAARAFELGRRPRAPTPQA